MDITTMKKMIEAEFELVRQQRLKYLEQVQLADVRLAQLQGKMELLIELEKEQNGGGDPNAAGRSEGT